MERWRQWCRDDLWHCHYYCCCFGGWGYGLEKGPAAGGGVVFVVGAGQETVVEHGNYWCGSMRGNRLLN